MTKKQLEATKREQAKADLIALLESANNRILTTTLKSGYNRNGNRKSTVRFFILTNEGNMLQVNYKVSKLLYGTFNTKSDLTSVTVNGHSYEAIRELAQEIGKPIIYHYDLTGFQQYEPRQEANR